MSSPTRSAPGTYPPGEAESADTGRAEAPPSAGDPSEGERDAAVSVSRRTLQVERSADAGRWVDDEVVGEFPLTLLVNGEEMATLVCTPSHLEELVLGFLTAEGILRRGERITRFHIDREEGLAELEAPERVGALEQEMFGKRYVGSCCGKSRTGFYMANDVRTARRVEADVSLPAGECFRLMADLQEMSPLFGRTGGVHNAGLVSGGEVEIVRTDIGRHNTLDKLYGFALREEISLEGRAVVFSGRISSEILLKISKMGCPLLLSKSAPTALALEMADELGVTAVGFLRGDRMNVYTHPGRITGI